jgi:hypothetical protein
LGRHGADPGIDRVAVLHDHGDQFTRQRRGRRVAFGLGEMPFEDRLRGPLSEVGLEDRRQRQSTSRASSALSISLRHHRR